MTSAVRRLDQRWEALKTERNNFRTLWQGIAKLCAPRSGRFLTTERNSGAYKHTDILNESGLFARRILAAGLMSGLTSPSRPWFELATEDQDRSEHQPHAQWLRLVRDQMLDVFRISNTYTALFSIYSELGPFGTAAAVVDEHFERVIHIYPQTVGQYALATDQYGMPNALWREFEMTAEQIVRRFVRKHGWGVVSPAIRTAYDQGNYDHGFDVRHAIRPRRNLEPNALNGRRFPVQSVYWDPNHAKGSKDLFLDDTGFEETPLVAPRWDVIGNDVYGYGCGEDALGSLRSLQAMEKDYQVAISKMARPPAVAPASLRDQGGVRNMPGGITYAPDGSTEQVRALENFQPRLGEFNAERQVMAERTYQAFYADVVTAISSLRRQGGGADPTATEIQEIVGEKLVMLGPVLERMQVELLEPLIDRTFAIMNRKGLIPPAPPDLQGRRLKVNHISQLALAQRSVATGAINRSMAFIGTYAEIAPEVLDAVNHDETLREFINAQGAPPKMLRTREEVEKIRADRAQQQAAAQTGEAMSQLAGAAKDAASVPTQGGESNLVADLAGL